jgi:hypothetical protein
MPNDTTVSLRVPIEAVRRVDRLVPLLQRRPEYFGLRITRAGVRRLAFLRGVAILEAEQGRGAKRSSSRRRRQ